MAEGYLRFKYGDKYDSFSAGIAPTHVNPYAIKVMNEIGIDISNQKSKSFQEFIDQHFDAVISTCEEAEEACSFFPAKKIFHWRLPDPLAAKGTADEILEIFRSIRDSIINRIESAVKNREI